RARAERDRLARHLRLPRPPAVPPFDRVGPLLALAYPDRVGQRRPGTDRRYVLRNGRGAVFSSPGAISDAPFIVAADLDDQRPETRIFIAAALALDDLREEFADQIVNEQVVEWDDEGQRAVARRRERLGALVLRDTRATTVDEDALARAMLGAIGRRGVEN